MAKIKNPWVGYLDRSYIQIKNSLLLRLGKLVPEVTDHSESNIMVIILSMFAGITEQLNYYIDNMAREAFITTARRYSSVVKHTRLIDYRIKAAIPASVDLKIDLTGEMDIGGLQLNLNTATYTGGPTHLNPFTIPQGTEFSTLNGITFISTAEVTFNMGEIIKIVPVQQKTPVVGKSLGITTGSIGQIYNLGKNYVNDSLSLTVGNELWERVNTLGRSGPLDKHYIVEISVDRVAYIVFGDGLNGKLPDGNLPLTGDYYESDGSSGNVGANNITQTNFNFEPHVIDKDKVEITNPLAAVSGSGYEGLNRIRRSAPLSLRTLDRAVTRQDYIDIARLAPGVDKATLHYDCGKKISIYISPNGGGIAPSSLLLSTKEYIDERKMVTTYVEVAPAGESYVQLVMDVYLKFRRDPIRARGEIMEAILGAYAYEPSDVNRRIRTSDIIALVDNVSSVDYLNLLEIYVKPYMRPVGHTVELLNNFTVRDMSVEEVSWEIRYYSNLMVLFKNGNYEANIHVGVPYNQADGIFTINILASSYQEGNIWEFKTYPKNTNLEINDYTVPVVREGDIVLNINEQLTTN